MHIYIADLFFGSTMRAIGSVLLAVVALSPCGATAADTARAPLYLKGAVLAIDDSAAIVTLAVSNSGSTPPPALSRFALPKHAGPGARDDAVVTLGAAIAANKAIPKWQVRLVSRTALTAAGVAPFNVGEDIAVVGYALNTVDNNKSQPLLQAHYLIGNGTVVPLRAPPR